MASSKHSDSQMISLRLTADEKWLLIEAKHKLEKERRATVTMAELITHLATLYTKEIS